MVGGVTEGGLEIGVTSRPWVDGPLVFFATDDILAIRNDPIHAGAIPLAETTGGGLAVLGSAPVANGDPPTGVVDVPGHRLAVLHLVDGTMVGLRQTTPY